MSELAHQLAHPARCLSLEELAASWSEVRIVARVEGYGHLAHDTVLLRRVRGGLGRVLIRASGTEPVLRVMVEARDRAQGRHLAERLVEAAKA